MNTEKIEIIEKAFENINDINSNSANNIIKAIESTIDDIDNGSIRVAEKINEEWITNQWIKKAILLYFRINNMKLISGSPGTVSYTHLTLPTRTHV